ncbi:hypothetical protein MUO14_09055 [Halobacillus shinanisalinarum]|uniref:Uncharacterized protein n=1 Tax=Halobacillus shinanisalinarum TaxID=2932258 RepID=A0ABY4H4K1_9BACI|nr:hypothetical protein [Halobacillus shinanisalinarum]UOQ95054.1 hypothetical protein MUO14_09055 [Halobacillus shinanisalinarum]
MKRRFAKEKDPIVAVSGLTYIRVSSQSGILSVQLWTCIIEELSAMGSGPNKVVELVQQAFASINANYSLKLSYSP